MIMKRKEYIIPQLKIVTTPRIRLLSGSGKLNDNGDGYTSDEIEENEEYNGLFN